MFIRSQDGTLLVNTNNVSSIFRTEDNEIRVLYTFRDGGDRLGVYGNHDEAVVVFQMITDALNTGNNALNDSVFNMPPQETPTEYTGEADGDS